MKKILLLAMALLGIAKLDCNFLFSNQTGRNIRYTVRHHWCPTKNEGFIDSNDAVIFNSGCGDTAHIARISVNDPSDPTILEGVISDPIGWTPAFKGSTFIFEIKPTGRLKKDGTPEQEFTIRNRNV